MHIVFSSVLREPVWVFSCRTVELASFVALSGDECSGLVPVSGSTLRTAEQARAS